MTEVDTREEVFFVDELDADSGSQARQETGARQASAPPGTVTILLCTFNGAEFLPQQLDSISAQTYAAWRLIVSDDGSSDGTVDLVARYKAAFRFRNCVEIRNGPQRGATANFLSLAADPSIQSDYFALCDQDDIWYPDKLQRAIAALRPVPSHIPALYCSRTRIVARDGLPLYLSPCFARSPDFRNALVQSVAGGNTMVMNRAARALLVTSGPAQVVTHDWWTYMLVSGSGGVVLYDPVATLDYRQHGNNQIGANQGLSASLRRLVQVARGRLRTWNDANTAALLRRSHLLTPENQFLLKSFCEMRSAPLSKRITLWRKARLYRQTKLGNLTLLIALLTNRL